MQHLRCLWLLALGLGACEAAPSHDHSQGREPNGATRFAAARRQAPPETVPMAGMIALEGGTVTTRELGGVERKVAVAPFFLDQREVTASDYWRCITAGACRPPWQALRPDCNLAAAERRDHPMNCLERDHAAAYCRWAGKRLPTSAEWQRAAAGVEARIYPWGNEPGADRTCRGGESTCRVGSHDAGATPEGVHDLVGNVWEMTDRVCGVAAPRPELCASFTTLLHGGGWEGCGEGRSRCGHDGSLSVARLEDVSPQAIGFRCARSR